MSHAEARAGGGLDQVTLRSPAELADALPYLLGYRPEDSIVLVALHDHGGYGSFGARARLGIPEREEDWQEAARQMARCLVVASERRGVRPEGMVAFVCREPESGRTGRQVMEALRPLAQLLRTECGSLDIPVLEALCISANRFWSYCCPGTQCCPEEGKPMGLPGSSVLSAAMTYAGLQVRGTLREFRARLLPWETAGALDQEAALDAASAALVPRILDESRRRDVIADTLALARRIMDRLATAQAVHGTLEADVRDDELIAHDEAADLILGLQDRTTRDMAAEWIEEDEAPSALRLWRALARRCVGPYAEHAAAPLTLAGWIAWSAGDELEAREALATALGLDPDYVFARLLHQGCNEGLDPEAIRRCLRKERAERTAAQRKAAGSAAEAEETAGIGAPETRTQPPPAGDVTNGPLPGAVGQRSLPGAVAQRSLPGPASPDLDDSRPPSTPPRRPSPRRPRRPEAGGSSARGPRPTRPRGTGPGTTPVIRPHPSRPRAPKHAPGTGQ
ncbi:DUF4192 domain-containing protein [Streptomyces sp. TS71-3]|uniref:DUF4192 domain-containing protein n=1 Tax=Streptomyces sp. TS71-3 TaxID=2733862 RepID=UPI0020173E44|nr:DUF4192 domain-containing protein [Streptomyces sp. TS71-3]